MGHLITFIGTVAASLVGAWFGARLALGRFKREKAYDRRVDWHVSALRTVHALDLQRQRLPTDHPTRPETYVAAREDFRRMIAEAPAFTTPMAARGLRLAELQFWEAERVTRAFIRDGEESELVFQGLATEGGFINDVEKLILKGLHSLMPPEEDYPWTSRVRSYVRAARKRLATKRKQLSAAERSAAS